MYAFDLSSSTMTKLGETTNKTGDVVFHYSFIMNGGNTYVFLGVDDEGEYSIYSYVMDGTTISKKGSLNF